MFGLFRPKYQRVVDRIYTTVPASSTQANKVVLNTSNMDKFAYFSLNSTEKVDKAAAYFHEKISKQIKKRKYDNIDISLQALDILLSSSSTHTYNLFSEHFLAVESEMLATNDQQLQSMAVRSLNKFVQLKKETMLYHGCYERLINECSAMCKEPDVTTRLNGVQGLHAIVRQIAMDELAENIWKPVHMNRIISGLLYCMSQYYKSEASDSLQLDPSGTEAEKCFSALMSTASFGQVVSVLNSVYNYLDETNLWGERDFTNYVYSHIMNSIQSRYWNAIVINAITHLEHHSSGPVTTKKSELKILCTLLELVKKQALGPLMFDYLNFLFAESSRMLSLKKMSSQELSYVQDLMECLEAISSNLADFESPEVMVFVTQKITDVYEDEAMRHIMFRCLYTVALNYKHPVPQTMMKPLLFLIKEPKTSEMGQTVFYTLFDVHGNLASVDEPAYGVHLINEPSSQGNSLLMESYDLEVYAALLKSITDCQELNPNHMRTVFKTLVTMGAYQNQFTIIRFVACLFLMQECAFNDELSVQDREKLLIVSGGLLASAARVVDLPLVEKYGNDLVAHRNKHLLGRRSKGSSGSNSSADKVGCCCLLNETKLDLLIVGHTNQNNLRRYKEEIRVLLNGSAREVVVNNVPLEQQVIVGRSSL